jgi:hypothetical protein
VITVAIFALLVTPAFGSATGARRSGRPLASTHMTTGKLAARYALRFQGTPYVWGGSTPAGFDCSGFVRYVYQHFGFDLPHSTYADWDLGRHIARSDLRPGDIVFFGLGHVGLWLGNGRFIHAPHTGTVVSIESIRTGWYAGTYSGAVRLPGFARYPGESTMRAPRRTAAGGRRSRAASRPAAQPSGRGRGSTGRSGRAGTRAAQLRDPR